MKITLKNLAAGRKELFKRIFVYAGSALATYEIINFLVNDSTIYNALSSFPVFTNLIYPVLNSLISYLVVAVVLAIIAQKSFSSFSRKIKGTDIRISLAVGNIFDTSGDVVVPCNNLFAYEKEIIGEKSIQYQLMQKCAQKYYTSPVSVEEQITNALLSAEFESRVLPVPEQSLNGKSYSKYPFGMLLPIKVTRKKKSKYFYLLSMSEIKNEGRPDASFQMVASSIDSMWKSMKKDGLFNDTLAIPVMGTGAAKMHNATMQQVAQYIIKSFAENATALGVKNLIISIYPGDYLKDNVDLDDLRNYVEFVCRFTEPNAKSPRI